MKTSAASWVKTMANLAQAEGLDVPLLFQQAGLDMENLANPHYRFSQDNISRLWVLMVMATGNNSIGLMFGKHVNLSTFGAVGYVFLCAPTVKQSLAYLIQYQRHLGEALACRITKQGVDYHFEIDHGGDKTGVSRQALDAILSSFFSLATWIFRQPIKLEQLLVGHCPVDELEAYQQLFHCPVSFRTGVITLILNGSWVESVLPTADPLMLQQQEQRLNALLLQSQQPWTAQTKQRINELLSAGEARKEIVASSLHVTPKTLQRRLEEEGSQYQHLLDECRQALACEFLRQAQIELIEIAELTGYKDYSTFAKAFKQWTGQTPKVWRDQHG